MTTPVAGWDGGAFTSPDFDLINYDIVLSGTTASSVPEPGTMALAAGAMLLLAVGRAILPAARFQPARRR